MSWSVGRPIEEAGDNEVQGMKASLGVPTPARDGEKETELAGKAGIIGFAYPLGGGAGWR